MRKFFALLLCLLCLLPASAFARFDGADGFGSAGFTQYNTTGFLSIPTAQFVIHNFIKHSNDFIPADGFWTAQGVTAPAPTATTVTDTLPDGTSGSVSSVVFGATTAGTTQKSTLFYTDTNQISTYPFSNMVYAKVTAGFCTEYVMIDSGGNYYNAAIPTDGQWHLIHADWPGSIVGLPSTNNLTVELGINQLDSTQRAPTCSTTIEFTGDYLAQREWIGFPSYADVKTGGPLATTGTTPLQAILHEPYPAHVANRDPSLWQPFSGNPILGPDYTSAWTSGGAGPVGINSQVQSGAFYWGWSAGCSGINGTTTNNFIAQCLYFSSDGLNWNEDTSGNEPQTQLSGSIFANPTVSSPGSGFTPGTGTATYTGTICFTPPVISVTVPPAAITIGSAAPNPNNGIGTGACNPWPTGSDTNWSYSGVGPGSGASFTFPMQIGAQSAPGPVRWALHPSFLPQGCNDGTTAHLYCALYSAIDASGNAHLYLEWADTVNGVYTPLGCAGPGPCNTVTPVTLLNLPNGYTQPNSPTVVNVGGLSGLNYIYVPIAGTNAAGLHYAIFTTPANPGTTTAGNTLTYLHEAGFSTTTSDWYSPSGTTYLLDVGIFQNHCGFWEMYYSFENSSQPSPPWPAGSPAGTQMSGEAVAVNVDGPWYQYAAPIITTNSGDSAAIELGSQFILATDAAVAGGAGANAFVGPLGTCP